MQPPFPAQSPRTSPRRSPAGPPTAFLLAFALAGPGVAGAVDRYVAEGGTAGGGCTSIADPCGSIGAAVFVAGPGDHVKVRSGTYAAFTVAGSLKDGLQVSGGWNAAFTSQTRDPSLTVVVSAGDAAALQDSGGGTVVHTFSNFTLTGGDLQITPSSTPGTLNKRVTLRNVVIRDSPRRGVRLSSSFADNQLTLELVNCLIHDNSIEGFGGGIRVDAASGSDVRLLAVNTTISGNHASNAGGALMTNTTGDGSSLTVDLINTIARGNSAPSGPDLYSGSVATTINLTTTLHGPLAPGPGNYVDHGGNLAVEPLFWLSAPGDYRLRPDSPAKDAGQCGFFVDSFLSYVRIAPYDDFEGDPRPGFGAASGCDIGADEAPLFEDRFELGHLGLWSSRTP